ncbi:MAG: thymidine kinase [Peptostreptococcaceae bacterium]|nr:thymidine kinase [Peptostreptococcaceae bacterium]
MYRPTGHGYIELVVGPMYSGKSEELIRRLKRAKIAKQEVLVFKPSIDDRYSMEDVISHSGIKIQAVAICDLADVWDHITPQTQVVGFDEVQFFETNIVKVVIELADRGIRVICAGLDMDFKAEPFGVIPELMARAEFVDKLQAVCVICGQPATRTQRIIDGKPAKYDDPVIMVGATESYEARCRGHHEIG